jgi:cell wall assembly regulator SMI1
MQVHQSQVQCELIFGMMNLLHRKTELIGRCDTDRSHEFASVWAVPETVPVIWDHIANHGVNLLPRPSGTLAEDIIAPIWL